MAIDGDTAQIGPELAEHLAIPHLTNVEKIIEIKPQEMTVRRSLDGQRQLLQIRLPALADHCQGYQSTAAAQYQWSGIW